ncbi:metallophosphoesterase family protein [Thermodesulfobacteriota bacterium]
MDRIALISDIHGNMPALEATLRDIRSRDVDKVLCLGDLVGKGPHSDRAVDICREQCDITVKGNWDDFITAENDNHTLIWHRQRLGEKRLNYLERLPKTIEFYMSGKRVRLFHASQKGVHYRVRMNDPRDKHLEMFSNTEFTGNSFEPDVVGYGDIHRTYIMSYQDKTLFNVGSVGNPLDLTQASYAILEGKYDSRTDGIFSMFLVRVPYDIELAIKQAEDEDMPDLESYANELRTGRYRGIMPPVN